MCGFIFLSFCRNIKACSGFAESYLFFIHLLSIYRYSLSSSAMPVHIFFLSLYWVLRGFAEQLFTLGLPQLPEATFVFYIELGVHVTICAAIERLWKVVETETDINI